MLPVQLTAAKHARPFAAFLAKNGEPVEQVLGAAGMPPSCLNDPKLLVPTRALWRFRQLAELRAGATDLGVAVMEPLGLPDLGDIGRIMLRAPTLGGMIHAFIRLAHTESSTTVLDLTPWRGGDYFFSNRFLLGHEEGEWQADLYLLMWMLKIVRFVDRSWSPAEIWCTAVGTPDRVRVIEALAARPRFYQRCVGFPIPGSMLALPLPSHVSMPSTPEEEARLWAMAPSESTADAIRQLIRAYEDDRWLTAQQAADVLGVTVRSLQRQLSAEGETFSAILEEARAERARDLLDATDAPLSEIARQLGYSNLSNFNRAFHRRAALSPREYRMHQRAMRDLRADP